MGALGRGFYLVDEIQEGAVHVAVGRCVFFSRSPPGYPFTVANVKKFSKYNPIYPPPPPFLQIYRSTPSHLPYCLRHDPKHNTTCPLHSIKANNPHLNTPYRSITQSLYEQKCQSKAFYKNVKILYLYALCKLKLDTNIYAFRGQTYVVTNCFGGLTW